MHGSYLTGNVCRVVVPLIEDSISAESIFRSRQKAAERSIKKEA
jgi:hypothetical protein